MYWRSVRLSARGSHARNEGIEEIAMATLSRDAQQRSAAAVKSERALDKVTAMQEYEAEALALRANTERLRALRLAKEAEDMRKAVTQPPPKKKAAPSTAMPEPKKATAKKRVSAPKRAGVKPPLP
jgi:hypothetical protein